MSLSGFCLFVFFSVFVVHLGAYGQENADLVNDKSSLISFMRGIVSDPNNALASWKSPDVHVCSWSGIRCNNASDRRVIEINLNGKSVGGTISPSISNLSSLKILDLSENFFVGHIPKELGFLTQLGQLSLSWNFLEGEIPAELSSLHNLYYLDMGSNKLEGEIPASLFCNGSSSLRYIDLSNNSLGGQIPLNNECLLLEVRFLLLWSNKLVGQVPLALANSKQLKWLDLGSNMLSGELPLEIVSSWPQLQFLYLSDNDFVSHDGNTNLEPFFASLTNLSYLQELEIAENNLGGKLPYNIGDLPTSLVQLHLDDNLIYGPIPPQIANLVNLTLLNFSSNQLNGSIPPSLCKMGKLERIYLSNNSLSGEIPSALGVIQHLGLLDLSRNKLSGSIPDSFANLSQLRRLLLYENQLSGTIPPSLGKCVNLEILDLSRNKISGVIPTEVAALTSLKLHLNLSSNNLNGPLPLELSKMDMVLAIDLSNNNLSGRIPPQLESCIALEYLNLSGNSLEGPLPISLGQLPYLKALDVSSNRLTGAIPESLLLSSTLKKLNFSFNKFSGNIPNKEAISSLSIDSFLGNDALCGSIKGMQSCHKKHSDHFVLLIIPVFLFAIPLLCMFGFRLVHRVKFQRRLAIFGRKGYKNDEEETKDLKYPSISYKQLIDATGGFSASSLIGSGRFGHVYKGVLGDNTRIAVKVLDTTTAGEFSGSFRREIQILKRTRHRNLIRIITICSKPEFKALVLPLMPNGSLERHLYPSHGLSHALNLVQVVKICSDVAEGMAYLHHYSPVRVIHCDLKPSNIPLDDDMTALVTDFGISRLVKGDENMAYSNNSASFSSTHGLLCGSVGYIAPEYGMGEKASTQGDVYSFGVLLLEIVTGRPPTDVLVHEGSSLHEWVKRQYPYKLDNIVDKALQRLAHSGQHDRKIWQDVVMELIELSLLCTQHNPLTRPSMLDVAQEMGRLKDYLCKPSSLLVDEAANSKVDDSFCSENNLLEK
ncbi:putative leucine-rich repeat receptor-like serine/threonine-protein kinase At2g24130 [Prosopis cineraria]|uniref:putative leucine-rich repeat receptor-like serine/threonine-protein kinase At2g24130 n=1 Tax=Prosopis cineraria TaxID=364024 RepID=UPI0024105280|nr:putative leucine-rich repeat receptor-like serine/threonine-protein kinase At2g24130 [Prosopis cineraria]